MQSVGMVVNLNLDGDKLPKCMKCEEGDLLPVQDIMKGTDDYTPYLKGWICSNPKCNHNVLFKGGNFVTQKVVSAD